MFVRRVPGITREGIGKVVDATVSEFRDQVDLAIADVRPGVAKAWLDEPARVAAGLVGAVTVLDHSLALCWGNVTVRPLWPERSMVLAVRRERGRRLFRTCFRPQPAGYRCRGSA